MRGISEGRCNMSAAYDAFYWYDRLVDEDYLEQMKEEKKMANKIEIDLDAITTRRDELMDLKARYKFELEQVEKEMKKLDLQLIALLDQTGTDSMDYKTYTFGWKTTSRTALDQKYLKEHYADVFAACYLPKEDRKFEFKINK